MRCYSMCLVIMLMLAALVVQVVAATEVGDVPNEVRKEFNLAPFYEKWVDVGGLPVVSSRRVRDAALMEAAWLIDRMIGNRPEILRAMASNRVRFSVMAYDELTTDVPEYSDLQPKAYWDGRARGLGASTERPSVSCGEENLLKFRGDPYAEENILIHEFGHAIHLMGLNTVDPTFDRRLQTTFDEAIRSGLWKGSYAASNKGEYWAEGVQSWFNTNRQNDAEHNHVNTRTELRKYDPLLATLLEEVFSDEEWRYTLPANRSHLPHLSGYSAKAAPKFVWPRHLVQQKRGPDFDRKAIELPESDLAKYEGVFASQGLPFKFTVKVSEGKLTAQATGQGGFILTPLSSSEFQFESAGLTIIFGIDGKKVNYSTFQLKQGGYNFKFTRE